jgi:hypothetical protein
VIIEKALRPERTHIEIAETTDHPRFGRQAYVNAAGSTKVSLR